jgi:phospholipid/cholesterol/gamma-HCH transport system substrate-binding protein
MEKIVGIFMLSVLILLLVTVVLLGRGKNWFQKYNTYYTTFDESHNLQPGAAVKFLETDIGKVKSIRLVQNHVEIELAVLELYASRIRKDVVAKVESPTFIGSEYIAIIPGKLDAPVIPPKGRIISVARKSINDYLEEFEVEKTARSLIVALQGFAEFVRELKDPDGALLAAIENLNKTAAHVEKITARIEAGHGSVGTVLNSTVLVDALMDRLAQADTILGDLAAASAKTPETVDLVRENLYELRNIRTNVIESLDLLQDLLREVEGNMPAVRKIIENTAAGSRYFPPIAESAFKGIDEARQELENLDMIIQALQKNFLIRSKLPPEPVGRNTDAHLRN